MSVVHALPVRYRLCLYLRAEAFRSQRFWICPWEPSRLRWGEPWCICHMYQNRKLTCLKSAICAITNCSGLSMVNPRLEMPNKFNPTWPPAGLAGPDSRKSRAVSLFACTRQFPCAEGPRALLRAQLATRSAARSTLRPR